MDRRLHRNVRLRQLTATALLIALTLPASALELGFTASLVGIASDNISADNSPDEREGTVGVGSLGVYGEQNTRLLRGAFSGEFDTRRRLDVEGDDFDTLTRFIGAAEVALTPRALRWYVGDILGGVRADNGVQPIDDTADSVQRRNVFVTGPSMTLDIDADTRLDARLLYVNQTEDDREVESLYNGSFDWRRETTSGSWFGFSGSDIFTDYPAANGQTDINRLSLAAHANRASGFNAIYGQLGGTRYDIDEQGLNGFNVVIKGTRTLGPTSSASVSLSRDLSDQTLNTVESLIETGQGLRPESEGIFDDTRLEAEWSLESGRADADIGLGVAHLDYRGLDSSDARLDETTPDELQGYAYLVYGQPLTPRLRGEVNARYERRDYDLRRDEVDSFLAGLRVVYRLSRSFELEAGYTFDHAKGQRTRLIDDAAIDRRIDVTENRATLGIRWIPPSRASQELTVELKSLLR